MVHDIHWSLDPYLPDHPNRPEVYYYNRNVGEGHLNLPQNYDIEALKEINKMRSEGWRTANAKED
jgi:hypothetical protein